MTDLYLYSLIPLCDSHKNVHFLYRPFSCITKTCGDKDGIGGGAVTCKDDQAPVSPETECEACVDDASECCLDKTCGIPYNIQHSYFSNVTFDMPVTCGPGFFPKDGNTPCKDCSDDGDDCCTAKTCATGNVEGFFAVSCSSYYFKKPGSTECTHCIDDDTECCAAKTCSDKTGSGGGAVTCGSNFVSVVSQPHTTSGTTGTCWEAYRPGYTYCHNYTSAGYTCVGSYCAALDPGGTPWECAVEKPTGYVVDIHTGRCISPLACSTCDNDGDECCIPIQNCAVTWEPWSTCQPGHTTVAVPGDGSGIDSERQCTEACGAYSIATCEWTAATASSGFQCTATVAAYQTQEYAITTYPQGGGTECPDPKVRRCKVDVSVFCFDLFFELIPLSYN